MFGLLAIAAVVALIIARANWNRAKTKNKVVFVMNLLVGTLTGLTFIAANHYVLIALLLSAGTISVVGGFVILFNDRWDY